jgi:phosphoribosylformylglycinamidine synthase
MLKPEILDPQGQAIANALPTLGFSGITAVRQGKRFEVEVDGDLTEDALAEVNRAAGTLLSNPVIEDFTVRVEAAEPDGLPVGDAAAAVEQAAETLVVAAEAPAATEAIAPETAAPETAAPETDGAEAETPEAAAPEAGRAPTAENATTAEETPAAEDSQPAGDAAAESKPAGEAKAEAGERSA